MALDSFDCILQMADESMLSPRDAEGILLYLSKAKRASRAELVDRFAVPDSALRILLSMFGAKGLLKDHTITPAGEELGAKLVERRDLQDAILRSRSYALNEFLPLIQRRMAPSKREIDQFRATPDTSVRRANLLYHNGDLEGRDIVFLGDNDLTSLAVGTTGLARSITVLEYDDQTRSFLERATKDKAIHGSIGKASIETIAYDARDPVSDHLKGRFRVAITDPPYTTQGIELFISRCVSMLQKGRSSVYLSYGTSPRSSERAIKIQRTITDLGLVVEEAHHRFNRYQGARSIGSTSTFYVLRTTPQTRPTIDGEYTQPIYTNEQA